jgi:outer membrane protein OmpA-like peptidoglycan-associated protein
MARIGKLIGSAAWIGCLLLVGCNKATEQQVAANTKNSPAAAPVAAAPAASIDATAIQDSIVSVAGGAFIVQKPREYSVAYSAIKLLDQDAKSNWTAPAGDLAPETFVIVLAGRAMLKTLQFDCGNGGSTCAHDVTVEVSDTGPDAGYSQIGAVEIEQDKDNQTFTVSAEKPARWVRLTIRGNHGAQDYIQLNDFRAAGTWLSHDPLPDLTGTWDTDWGDFHVRQQGTAISGCYYTRGGIYQGGVEARAAKFSWCENCGATSEGRGTGTVVVSPDGNSFEGLYWNDGNSSPGGFSGKRKSQDPGMCSNWRQGGIGEELAADLEASGRARIQGINFNSDSDAILPESRPLLDEIVKIAKARPAWKLTVEGHTDATSTAEHNQDLSERRARAVVAYLTAAGIEASRLTSQGFGATKPIADDGNPLGRAQNRRVELVRS